MTSPTPLDAAGYGAMTEVKSPPAPINNGYPRFLKLAEETKRALAVYLQTQITNHRAERTSFDDEMVKYQNDYWAKSPAENKNFPFAGAAKLIIPLTAIAVEAIHARTMTTMFGLKQTVYAKAKSDKWADVQGPYEKFIEQELKVAKFRDGIEPSILEIEKLGTGIGKAEWEQQIRYGVQVIGDREIEFPVYTKRGAYIHSTPLTRFVMPFACTDPQTAPWCGELHVTTQHDLYLGEQSGMFEPGTYQGLYNWIVANKSSNDKYIENQRVLDKQESVWPSQIEFYKIYMAYDVDNSGTMKEICVYWHHDSRVFMGIRYNTYKDLRRPYRKGVYFPVEHRWTGIGIGKQNEQFQEEVTTQHRQRIDNATIANMRMFKVSRMSGYGAKEPIFPGKLWFLDDMTHIESFQAGEVYNSAYSNENQTVLYSQQRSGVNEVTLGMPQVGTPGTATGDLARVQEGRKKFDYTYGNIKNYANSLITDFAALHHQYGPRRIEYLDETSGGQILKSFLQLPEENVTEGILLEIGAAGEQDNRLIDRNNWVNIAAMLSQYWEGMIALAADRLQDQALTQRVSMKAMQSATEAMRQVLESFEGVRNIDRILMLELINNPQEAFSAIAGLGNTGNGAGGQGQLINPSTQEGVGIPTQDANVAQGGGASALSRILASFGGA